jgi:hypothetical protein
MQKTLSGEQVSEFYHDNFVADQVASFAQLVGPSINAGSVIADVGGGCGFFGRGLASRLPVRVRVLDTDPVSVRTCLQHGVDARLSDALKPDIEGDEAAVCFNLILHHLVGATAGQTRSLQSQALSAWHGKVPQVFVNEYIYESFVFERFSAYLIWFITSSRLLSTLAQFVARFVPALRANTFGIGVRFRAAREWQALFEAAGYELVSSTRGAEEFVSLSRRMMLIRSCRRDSFLLRARPAA